MADEEVWTDARGPQQQEVWRDVGPPATAGDIAKDVAASAAIGVPRGVIGMAGLPEQVAGWGAQGLSYLTGRPVESFRDQNARLPSTEEIQRGVESVTGPFYEPKTTYGK